MKRTIWMLAVALGATGCDGAMMSDSARMRSMLDELRVENDVHVSAAYGADSLAAMRGEQARHAAAMDDMMDEMGTMMNEMSHCTGSGMEALRDMHDGMSGEMDQHGPAMDRASALDAAAAEVARHAGAVGALLDGMDEATDRMGCGHDTGP
jgi:hypothetical protein